MPILEKENDWCSELKKEMPGLFGLFEKGKNHHVGKDIVLIGRTWCPYDHYIKFGFEIVYLGNYAGDLRFDFSPEYPERIDIGWIGILDEYHRKGICKNILEWFIDKIMTETSIKRILMQALTPGSKAMASKLGFEMIDPESFIYELAVHRCSSK